MKWTVAKRGPVCKPLSGERIVNEAFENWTQAASKNVVSDVALKPVPSHSSPQSEIMLVIRGTLPRFAAQLPSAVV
jgi:hypothetical protein